MFNSALCTAERAVDLVLGYDEWFEKVDKAEIYQK